MGLFAKLAGISGSLFGIGGPTGPVLANDGGSGNIGARNAGNSAYVNMRAAAPTVSSDLVTLSYFNAHSGGAGATETVAGTVVLGALCYNQIPSATIVVVASGATLLQAGNLDIVGDLDLSSGDICWVD